MDRENDTTPFDDEELFETVRKLEFGPKEPMGIEDFRRVFEIFAQDAGNRLLQTGTAEPMLFLPTLSEGQILRLGVMPVGHLLATEESKRELAELMDRLLENPNHDILLLSHEALIARVEVPAGEDPQAAIDEALRSGKMTPESGAQDVLFFVLRSSDAQAICHLPILRDASGAPVGLGEGELIFSGLGEFSGDFSGAPKKRTLH